jgi:hypothetical protein
MLFWKCVRRRAAEALGLGLMLSLSACASLTTGYGYVPSPTPDGPGLLTPGAGGTATLTMPTQAILPDTPTATLGVLPTSGPTVTRPATVPAT